MKSDDVNRAASSPRCGPDPLADEGSGDGAMRILRAAAGAQQSAGCHPAQARIPLEQLERELLRLMHIELASLLVRARDLVRRSCADPGDLLGDALLEGHPVEDDLSEDGLFEDNLFEDSAALALQCEAGESIDVARACGVRVPRIARRLLAGGPATWPSAARLERWARLLDPDVECGAFERGVFQAGAAGSSTDERGVA